MYSIFFLSCRKSQAKLADKEILLCACTVFCLRSCLHIVKFIKYDFRAPVFGIVQCELLVFAVSHYLGTHFKDMLWLVEAIRRFTKIDEILIDYNGIA